MRSDMSIYLNFSGSLMLTEAYKLIVINCVIFAGRKGRKVEAGSLKLTVMNVESHSSLPVVYIIIGNTFFSSY